MMKRRATIVLLFQVLTPADPDLACIEDVVRNSDLLMLQLEMDMRLIEAAVMMAEKHDVPVILNPAPAQSLADELLEKVTYLTPNETEAQILTGVQVVDRQSAERAAQALWRRASARSYYLRAPRAMIADQSATGWCPRPALRWLTLLQQEMVLTGLSQP